MKPGCGAFKPGGGAFKPGSARTSAPPHLRIRADDSERHAHVDAPDLSVALAVAPAQLRSVPNHQPLRALDLTKRLPEELTRVFLLLLGGGCGAGRGARRLKSRIRNQRLESTVLSTS